METPTFYPGRRRITSEQECFSRLLGSPWQRQWFWSRVRVGHDSECWPYSVLTPKGYGKIARRVDGSILSVFAHRAAKMLSGESPPVGLVADHLCQNRSCCNPAHIEWVSATTNIRRGKVTRRRTLCKKGIHPLSGNNVVARKNGNRECRLCSNNAQRLRRKRRYHG